MEMELLVQLQRAARHRVSGHGQIDKAQVATYAVAMTDEILELAKEIGWKPWKPIPRNNNQLILEEMADVIAFFGTWLDIVQEVTGASLDQIFSFYMVKEQTNRRRFNGEIEGFGVEEISISVAG